MHKNIQQPQNHTHHYLTFPAQCSTIPTLRWEPIHIKEMLINQQRGTLFFNPSFWFQPTPLLQGDLRWLIPAPRYSLIPHSYSLIHPVFNNGVTHRSLKDNALPKLIIALRRNYRKSVHCDVTNLISTKLNRLWAQKNMIQRHTSVVVWVPSGRWQSCLVWESWPPSAAVGTMPPVSPSLSPPKTFPHQPAGTEK